MKKLLIIVFALMLLGLIAFWAFVSFGPKNTTTGGPSDGGSTLPTSGYTSVPTPGNSEQGQLSTSMAVIGVGGTIIPTRDFLHASSTGEYPVADHFYLGYHAVGTGVDNATATNDPPYLIQYTTATQYFNIVLLNEPIGTTRLAAEQFLMVDLGISQSQMCQLSYMVAVPNSVNSQFAGKNLGFSFCPGATPLPK